MADARFMAEAVALADGAASRGEGGPFGAVVVRGGEIVARGWNRVTGTNDPTAHAEVVAIREACRILGRFHLEDCELYASCEPCPMCLAAAHWARLKVVHYAATREDAAAAGFDDAAMYAEANLPPEQRTVPCRPMPEAAESAAAAMRGWAADPRKSMY
jgi:tRNA(Arg) A34 adenosine deaminase TadA